MEGIRKGTGRKLQEKEKERKEGWMDGNKKLKEN